MSEQEVNVIDITDRLRQKQLKEAAATNDSQAFAPKNEQSPSLMKLVGRKIHAAVRTLMPPQR